ncbi:3-keto-steroid reductase [Toensbergia leucococca]|nr:3-keto-steroid reductase [Toensbergia leucococca]
MSISKSNTDSYVLVTGANSGLGFAICCRLVDEFIATRLPTQHLTLIYTTRTPSKSITTLQNLQAHLRQKHPTATSRITFRPESLDLNSLHSVQLLARTLLATVPKLDVLLLNAGYSANIGIDWLKAIWSILTDTVYALTWPSYKIGAVGETTGPQLPPSSSSSSSSAEESLGKVFCSNVFGHYLLAHYLSPLLSTPPSQKKGRIIWISSIDLSSTHFTLTDLQGLHTPHAYESSKRLTDILAVTSSLPSTTPWTKSYLSPSSTSQPLPPKIYLAHPGVCATNIVPLAPIMHHLMILSMYLARLLLSPWHTIKPYKGACAPVWLALAPQTALDAMEASKGPGKWGSNTDFWGEERVTRTEVEGWGYGGRVGDEEGRTRKGRMRGVKALTAEGREAFEELGRECWRAMEELRGEWEARLSAAGARDRD